MIVVKSYPFTADEAAALTASVEWILSQKAAMPPEFKGPLVSAADKLRRIAGGEPS